MWPPKIRVINYNFSRNASQAFGEVSKNRNLLFYADEIAAIILSNSVDSRAKTIHVPRGKLVFARVIVS